MSMHEGEEDREVVYTPTEYPKAAQNEPKFADATVWFLRRWQGKIRLEGLVKMLNFCCTT